MECIEGEKDSGRAAVAETRQERCFLVVWLGKRGRVCRKSSGFKTGRSVNEVIFYKVRLSTVISDFVRSLQKARLLSQLPTSRLESRLDEGALSGLCRPSSHFNVLLNAELGQGLFDAQGRQAGSSVGIPTLTHDFSHNPESLIALPPVWDVGP